ncbi:sulfatase-like hydrolase/transferase [Corynebacterium cystitidis]|uniref:Arylsulfatase n=1 Tax=Corynebacterium cystitidis DSM 20524 TaxID=1121357 RepID=A0A1H9VVD1_9CORY|nr:sulfatase-like hydrolase/transferase [Corynebacterium cystitidis]WJY81121.1 Choline-sulfatase [Corynebacterium cystitidis DSM 20524]SES25488.1 arylsulfatase [Corynebacterium cystitidis DSM 20524]SNV89865.1 arylsulfatase [Corynebacterium cystitidis]
MTSEATNRATNEAVNQDSSQKSQPNILVLCMDQWDMHMDLPEGVELPNLKRLEDKGVTLEQHYCTVPQCTPSRTTMWTGQHAKTLGMWDNTDFAWIKPLGPDTPTVGDMMREQGYYTAFKGKWHLSEINAGTQDALEDYGFSDYQTWGDNWGRPMEGQTHDGTVAEETVDWLRYKAPQDKPWLLVSSMVNPHDIMFFRASDVEEGDPRGFTYAKQHGVQSMGILEQWHDPSLPKSLDDDLADQPLGVHNYRDFARMNYTAPPEGEEGHEVWKQRRNYLINSMRLVDYQFGRIFDELDRQGLWENTVVLFTSDHGEMNGAHGMTQKGGIHYNEATVVNMTGVVPGGAQGQRSSAVGSHVDVTPTILAFAGLNDEKRAELYPDLPGRDLSGIFTAPETTAPPRGDADEPGAGALLMWEGLHQLDPQWGIEGALGEMTGLPLDTEARVEAMKETGKKYGAPDFKRRTFFRAVVDGQYKLVRWFSPTEYAPPQTVEELYETSDVTVHDLVNDPDELENIGNPDNPKFDRDLVDKLLAKLNALIKRELGDDDCPMDLGMFGTRDVTYNA